MVPWTETKEALFVDWLCYAVAIVFNFCLLVRHVLLLRGRLEPRAIGCGACIRSLNGSFATRLPPTEAGSGIHEKVVYWGTFCSMLLYFLYCCNHMTIYMSQGVLGWLPFGYCKTGITLTALWFVTAKCALYSVFVARLSIAFEDSIWAYSNRLIYFLYAAIAVFALVTIASSVIFIRGNRIEHGSVDYCETEVPNFLVAFIATFDFTFMPSVVYMFSSSLKKTLNAFPLDLDAENRAHDLERNAEMYILPLKYTLVSSVAIISSIITVIQLAIFRIIFLFAVDSAINCLSLVLMTAKWQPVFVVLCTPLLRCVAGIPCLPCVDLSAAEVVELFIRKQSTVGPSASSRRLTV